MYDTIYAWLPAEATGMYYLMDTIPDYLSEVRQITDRDTGEVTYYGLLGNLQARVNDRGILIKGSLSRYYLGDNFQTLSRGDTERAAERLSDELHLPISKASVWRIDVAHKLIVKHPESVYYYHLGALRYSKRFEQENSLYYRNARRELQFYSKVKEQKAKGETVPELYLNRNVLRYEMRLTKKLPKQLNMAEVSVATLSTESFYMGLATRWKNEYFAINKERNFSFNMDLMKSVKDFEQQIYLAGLIATFGSQREALEAVTQANKKGVFDHRVQKQRLTKRIKALYSQTRITEEAEVIQELDKKIKEAIKFYR